MYPKAPYDASRRDASDAMVGYICVSRRKMLRGFKVGKSGKKLNFDRFFRRFFFVSKRKRSRPGRTTRLVETRPAHPSAKYLARNEKCYGGSKYRFSEFFANLSVSKTRLKLGRPTRDRHAVSRVG
jgi:hypothetical protein